jgi:uncharacterized RDD family membrane protein YckC
MSHFKTETPLGSLWERIGAYVIDHILVTILGLLVMGIVVRGSMLLGLYGIASLVFPHLEPGPVDATALWESSSDFERFRVIVTLAVLPRWIYMTVFHGQWQATPGKMLLGLRVVNTQGIPIGYKTAALRSFLRGLLYACTIGLSGIVNVILIGATRRRRAIHDLIVGTEVVRGRKPATS